MSRSTEKGPFVHEGLSKRIEEMNASGDRKIIKTWPRSSTILPQIISHAVAVHDGREHVSVFVGGNVAGHKLGEFALTRTYRGHDYDGKTVRERKQPRKGGT